MKKIKKTICLLLLSTTLLLEGCLGTLPGGDGSNTVPNATKAPSVTEYHLNTTYTYRTEIREEWFLTNLNPAYLLLANKTHLLGADYEPDSMVRLDNSILASWHHNEVIRLETRTATALSAMLAEMKVDGVTDILVTSAFRNYQYQENLYRKYLEKEKSSLSQAAYLALGEDYIKVNYIDRGLTCLNEQDATKVVLSYSAPAGASEHQTGLCVDFITSTMYGELTEAFANTEAFAWLSQNAYRFGFILRYPQTKEGVTGYSYEPWHYRFVGREAATDIYFGNLTLEEYLGQA